MMNVNDGIVSVIGELRCLVVERDNKIAELVTKNNDLGAQIGKISAAYQEVLDANRRLAEKVRISEANMNSAKVGDKECQQTIPNHS